MNHRGVHQNKEEYIISFFPIDSCLPALDQRSASDPEHMPIGGQPMGPQSRNAKPRGHLPIGSQSRELQSRGPQIFGGQPMGPQSRNAKPRGHLPIGSQS